MPQNESQPKPDHIKVNNIYHRCKYKGKTIKILEYNFYEKRLRMSS